MTFESLESAQREAAYLKYKTCSEIIKNGLSCNYCKLLDFQGDCTIVAMNDPLSVIEKVTGEKCEIVKPVSE